MTIQELNSKYNFHDSCITKIEYDSTHKSLSIYMDFCNWAQSWYKESDSELLRVKLSFEGIDDYNNIKGEIDYFSIGNAEIKDGKYFLFIEDDFNSKYYELFLTPTSATFEILGEVDENNEN